MITKTSRKTRTQWLVLKALSQASDNNPLHGFLICRLAGLKSGTVYPMLREFARRGLVASYSEKIDPVAAGRPCRTFYEITAAGFSALEEYGEKPLDPNWVLSDA